MFSMLNCDSQFPFCVFVYRITAGCLVQCLIRSFECGKYCLAYTVSFLCGIQMKGEVEGLIMEIEDKLGIHYRQCYGV